VRFTVGDVDLDRGVVLIAHAKFGRQRMVRLDPSSCDALAGYLSVPVRRRSAPDPRAPCWSRRKAPRSTSTPLEVHFTYWCSTLVCRLGPVPARVPRLSPHVRDPNHDRRLPLWP
jgi:hypothetical protein